MRICQLFILAAAAIPAAAQNCNGNIDLSGPYEFTVSRLVWAPVAFAPPGTINAAILTPGRDAAQRTGTQGSFALIGRLIADGAGGLFSTVADAGIGTEMAGTYAVTSDCAVTLTLDGPGAQGSGKAAFHGFLWNRGEEAVLAQMNLPPSGLPAQVRMSRPFHFTGCTNSTLSGLYGLTANGIRALTAREPGSGLQTAEPFALNGQILADGNGAFRLPGSGGADLLAGTYSVNNDCTGTATIESGAESHEIDFVLVQDPGSLNRPALRLTLRGAGISGTGIAR